MAAVPMSRIQLLDSFACCGDDRIVALATLGLGVREVAQDRKRQVCLAIGEELHLQRFQCVTHIRYGAEQNRNHHGRAELRWHAVLVQVESCKYLRWKQRGHQLIQHRHRDVQRRQECEQQQHDHRRARVRLDQQQHAGGRQHHQQRQANGEDGIRMRVDGALDALADRQRITGDCFQLAYAVIDQVIADMCGHVRMRTVVSGRTCRQVNGPLRHRRLAMPGALGDAFHHVPVPVARRECHAWIEAGRVRAQDGFHHTLLLDEVTPVSTPDIAQARDAVGHHQLRQRQAMRGLRDGCLGTDACLTHPVLEPGEWRR